jgi:hypothetical protein
MTADKREMSAVAHIPLMDVSVKAGARSAIKPLPLSTPSLILEEKR